MTPSRGMHGRNIAALVVGPRQVRIVVRITHGDVEKLYALLPQELHQPGRLGVIRLMIVLLVSAPSVWVRHLVISAETHGHGYLIPELSSDLVNDIAERPGAVLKAAPVLAFPRVRREQFREKISVAGFDIDCIETDLSRHLSRFDELLFQLLQLLIGDHMHFGKLSHRE